MEGIKAEERGVVLLMAKKEFKDSNKNNCTASAIQEWFFKKKILMLAFRLIESGKNARCQEGDGVFWFKSKKKYNIFNGKSKFILFCYNKNIIAFARLKDAQLVDEPIVLNNNKKEIYNGYFIISNIVVFEDIINEYDINLYFEKSKGGSISLELQNYANIQCKKDFNKGEKNCQEIIDDAEELSKNDKWKTLENAPKWFKNIEEFCKF